MRVERVISFTFFLGMNVGSATACHNGLTGVPQALTYLDTMAIMDASLYGVAVAYLTSNILLPTTHTLLAY